MRKKGKFKLLIVLLLIACLLSGPALPFYSIYSYESYAVSEEEQKAAQEEADKAKAATEEKRKEAKEAAKKAAAATKNFEEAEEKLDALQGQMEATKAQIEATRAQIEKTKEKIKKKEAEIKEQNDALNNRLTAMYKTGTVGFVDVILNSESVEELLANVGMVHKILESDQELLRKLQKDYKELKKIKKELEEQEAALESQEIALEADQIETEELKKKYKAEADEWHKKEQQLEAEALELAADAAQKQAAAEAMIVENGGEVNVSVTGFAFPLNPGWKITSNYGWRICPFHGREFHNGLDLVFSSGTSGSPVYAIADGIITRASWYGGYGNCIQLACGDGYSALYGHLKGYNCSKGQFVHKGDLIGYVGSTGNSTGPHLHFTVFRNGSTINPLSLY